MRSNIVVAFLVEGLGSGAPCPPTDFYLIFLNIFDVANILGGAQRITAKTFYQKAMAMEHPPLLKIIDINDIKGSGDIMPIFVG